MARPYMAFEGRCERCFRPTATPIPSFFTDEVVCMPCVEDERALMARLRYAGIDPNGYAGCGRLPTEPAAPPPAHHKAG